MKEERGRAGKDCVVRGRHGDPEAKSEGGILNLTQPFIKDLGCDLPVSHNTISFLSQAGGWGWLVFISY